MSRALVSIELKYVIVIEGCPLSLTTLASSDGHAYAYR